MSRLIAGYRGSTRCDLDAAIDALVALGRIALDLEPVIASIDINPFVALPEGQGGEGARRARRAAAAMSLGTKSS